MIRISDNAIRSDDIVDVEFGVPATKSGSAVSITVKCIAVEDRGDVAVPPYIDAIDGALGNGRAMISVNGRRADGEFYIEDYLSLVGCQNKSFYRSRYF